MEYIEQNCTIEHEGKTFESGGAVVTLDYAIAYPEFAKGEECLGGYGDMRDWHGNVIGTAKIVAAWRTPRSFVSSYMFQIEATIDGIRYTGRGAGSGMLWRGKRKAR